MKKNVSFKFYLNIMQSAFCCCWRQKHSQHCIRNQPIECKKCPENFQCSKETEIADESHREWRRSTSTDWHAFDIEQNCIAEQTTCGPSYTLHMNYIHISQQKDSCFHFLINAWLRSIVPCMWSVGCEPIAVHKKSNAPQILHSAHSWMMNCRKYGNQMCTHGGILNEKQIHGCIDAVVIIKINSDTFCDGIRKNSTNFARLGLKIRHPSTVSIL